MVKGKEGRYFIGFSEDGNYCSDAVSENHMVELLNDKELSDETAMDIYVSSPQLACWLE